MYAARFNYLKILLVCRMVDDVECSRLVEREVLDISLDISNNNGIGIDCGSLEHNNDNCIREGNRSYVILTFDDDSWSVSDIICKKCSVRDAVERNQGDSDHVAVVEALLAVNLPESKATFQEPKIWELMK